MYILYSITCLTNFKTYIGVTIKYKPRINKHKSNLSLNKHDNGHLQDDYNKYGKTCFVFDVIATYEDKNEALRVEKYYTDFVFFMNKEICYNIISGGQNVIPQIKKRHQEFLKTDQQYLNKFKDRMSTLHSGKIMSKESRKKMSDGRKGYNNGKSKPVLDTETGIEYSCLSEAALAIGENYNTVRARINGYNKQKTSLKWLQ